jgi:hypothetical protein
MLLGILALLLAFMAAGLALATWTLNNSGPGSVWVATRFPAWLVRLMQRLGKWFDAGETHRPARKGTTGPRAARLRRPGAAQRAEGTPDGDLHEFPRFAEAAAAGDPPVRYPPPPTKAAPPAPSGNGSPPPASVPVHAAQADLLHAIHGLVGMAHGGDAKVARRVIATFAAGSDAMGQAATHIARRLSEPDKHYGSEIWEPVGTGGHQLCSGSMHFAQALAMVDSLLRMTGSEMADSPRQIPHHSQYNGGNG